MLASIKSLLTISFMSFLGCFSHPKYLESKYLLQKRVTARLEESNVVVTVTGLCGHSALGVGRAHVILDGNTLRVEFPLKCGSPGTICEKIMVPNSVDKVVLAGDLIWERNSKAEGEASPMPTSPMDR